MKRAFSILTSAVLIPFARLVVAPTPSDELEVDKVRLLSYVGAARLRLESFCGFYQSVSQTVDQIMGLQETVDRGFGCEAALFIGKPHSELAVGQP